MQDLELIDEMIALQEKKLFELGCNLVPNLTQEDILQPFDYPELEKNGHFRYEEGVLQGIYSVRAALLAWKKER